LPAKDATVRKFLPSEYQAVLSPRARFLNSTKFSIKGQFKTSFAIVTLTISSIISKRTILLRRYA
jgi:hypothetical protein